MKTKLLTILILLGAYASSNLLAQENTRQFPRERQTAQPRETKRPQQGERQRPSREEMRKRMLQYFDADGDGQLSQVERKTAGEVMQARRAKMQQRHEAGGEVGSRDAQIQRGNRRFQRQNGEGQRSAQDQRGYREFQRGPRQQRRQSAQQGERRQGQQGPSQEERRARMLQYFDANGDGQLDEHEKKAMHEAMQKRRAAHEGSGPTREAKQERGRRGHESGDAPRFGRRQFQR